MVVINDMDRFHLVMDVIDRVPGLGNKAAWLRQQMVDMRARHRAWIQVHGEDLPEVRDWTWGRGAGEPGPVPVPAITEPGAQDAAQ
jgi:xylulose-5-phosphate/fructose-6-phosphate phosphoketolase